MRQMSKHSELEITQQDVIQGLPSHLRKFVQVQDSERYTARDHAAWRFLMKHLTHQLSHTAHPVFREGLAGTGIRVDRIPSIDEMNNCLAKLGWRAVTVNGFIPPAIFMEFQARKILPIAIEMRPVEQLLYTPAPDFLHESTGHAPFLVDTDYAEFLQRFGEVGMYAIVSDYDGQKFDAIHLLSSLEKSPSPDPDALALAKSNLAKLNSVDREASEAELLARLHWWTVEYGLVGSLDDYRIFGAGLLSSLGESQHCFNSASVKKLPLTVNAVAKDYDITRAQPQLYVTQSCKHLTQVLNEFAKSMGFNTGGIAAVRKAIAAGTVCTARYDTGIEVSGVLCEVLCDAVDNPIYLRAGGPSQIAFNHQQLPGHGTDRHSDGFGSPIGGLKDMPRCLTEGLLMNSAVWVSRPAKRLGLSICPAYPSLGCSQTSYAIIKRAYCSLSRTAWLRPSTGAYYSIPSGANMTSLSAPLLPRSTAAPQINRPSRVTTAPLMC